jgi:hypothetical protein
MEKAMMKQFLAVFVMILFSAVGASTQTANANLTTTLQWMHDFVATNGHTSSTSNPTCKPGETCKLRIDDFSFTSKGCSVVTTWKVRIGINDFYDTVTDIFSLKDLDPSHITVEDDEMFWGTWVATFNNRELVKEHTEGQNAPGEPAALDGNSDMTHVGFHTQEQANRFAKALKHAIALCGGRSSAF